jgi:DNA-binding GntR family transcriptional regulator
MSGDAHTQPMDTRFIISMMPDDLREEMFSILSQNPDHEEALWWNTRSDEDFHQLAYSMMNDDYLWNVWREALYDAMREEKRHIEIRRKELQDKQ